MSEMTASHPEDWVDSYGDALFRFALTRVRKTEVAEDLVQETFLAALKESSPFASGSAQLTWLTGILRHKIADYFRKKARESSFTDLEFCEGEFSEKFHRGFWNHDLGPKDWGQNPEAALESGEFLQTLDHCLHKLPERVAAVFSLREIDETPGTEVCATLGISESNLWTMLHRARMALRECLEKNWFAAP
jgi:RNA polymerase sigma-70 factor (ECF subfamily)